MLKLKIATTFQVFYLVLCFFIYQFRNLLYSLPKKIIKEPWFDMYLRARDSIVLNYNPFISFASDPNPKQMNQVENHDFFLKKI